MKLKDLLKEQKNIDLKGNIYHITQIDMAYNSNRIEGSSLTSEQTRYIYETKTIVGDALVNDVLEVINHFRAFDYMLDTASDPLSETMIKEYHRIIKAGTDDVGKEWFNVGEYKKYPNQFGNISTTDPPEVSEEIDNLLIAYNFSGKKSFEDILDFHYRFERIHPFQDGNGRVGRLLMFKECLRNNVAPFIVRDENKSSYFKGLQEYTRDKNLFLDYCKKEQIKYKELCKSLYPELAFDDRESMNIKKLDIEI